MPYKAKAVANYLLALARVEGVDVTPLKLQKLVYFAHGYWLAFEGKPLISENFSVWKYGPVLNPLYSEFRDFGREPISRYATGAFDPESLEFDTPQIPTDDVEVREYLKEFWDRFKGFSAIELSNMTHAKGSPWEIASKNNESVLSNEAIQAYFSGLIGEEENDG